MLKGDLPFRRQATGRLANGRYRQAKWPLSPVKDFLDRCKALFLKEQEENTVMDPYKAYLQELMDAKRLCTIRYRSVEGGVSEIRAHIVDLTSAGDRDILETDAGFSIGLDKILEVNGRLKDDYC